MATVLYVHQSADLYGSDKVLLDIALEIRSRGYYPIVVVPESGPLVNALLAAEIETHVANIAKLNRKMLSPSGLIRLPFAILDAIRQLNRIVRGRRIDLVHSNTLATLGGAIWAKWHNIPHVWHTHELVISPNIARIGFPRMVYWLSKLAVCNSSQTEKWLLDVEPRLRGRTRVVWNGIRTNCESRTCPPERPSTNTIVALVGRINRLKGQAVLIDAATYLWQDGFRNVSYLVVGSPPSGQRHYLDALREKIASSPARDAIELQGFTENVTSIWDRCDIAVVPSTEPESFGLVAIEAMAAGKPVVASAHGGILDIVVNRETGILIPPNDPTALASAIAQLIKNPGLRKKMGAAGKARQRDLFSLGSQLDQIDQCYKSLTV